MSRQLGGVIQTYRRRAGLTQQQTADLAGLSVAALRDLEQGRVATPRPATLRRLAEALRLPAAELEELLRWAQPGRAPADDLWLRVLGPMSVRVDGVVLDLGSPRQRLLLGLLALRANTPLPAEALIEAVWGAQAPANAADLLRTHVSRLRRRLRPGAAAGAAPLVATHGGYQLAATDNQVDVLMFRRLRQRAQAARRDGDVEGARRLFAEAMRLWRGGPVADLPALHWHPAVAELNQEWRTSVVEYAEVAAELGHHDEVLPWLRQVVDTDPWYEAAQARLLVALDGAGQRQAALSMFDQFRRRLADELGVDPGPDLLAAYRTVRRRAAGGVGAVAASRQLPPDPSDFVGRAEELRQLHEWVSAALDNTPPVCVVEGTVGVGKTRLAVHLAHQLIAAGHCDEQLYVDLAGFSEQPCADPYPVLGAFLALLGVPAHQLPADLDARAALYRDRLVGRRTVVLLDNAASAEQVLPLLPGGMDNVVLVTSRRTLALDGAQVLPLAEFSAADAQRLLVRTLGVGRVAGERDAAARLVELCDRLPLALSLVARRLCARPSWRLSELVDRVERAPDRLCELAAGSGQLRARFDLSYRALGEAERHLLQRLGRHGAEQFTLGTAAALTGLAPPAARRLLDRLVDEHLLVMLGGDTYRLPSLLGHYARGQAAAGAPPAPRRDQPTGPTVLLGAPAGGPTPLARHLLRRQVPRGRAVRAAGSGRRRQVRELDQPRALLPGDEPAAARG